MKEEISQTHQEVRLKRKRQKISISLAVFSYSAHCSLGWFDLASGLRSSEWAGRCRD